MSPSRMRFSLPLLLLAGCSSTVDGELTDPIDPTPTDGDLGSVEGPTGTVSSELIQPRIQIVTLNSCGQPWHATKTPTTFSAWKPIQPGPLLVGFTDVDAVQMPNGDLHLFAAANGGLYHSIRRQSTGTFQTWSNVKEKVGDYGYFTRVSTCRYGNNIGIFGVTDTGRLWGGIHYLNGSWMGFMYDAERAHSADPSTAGPYRDVDCAWTPSAPHIVAAKTNGQLVHSYGSVFAAIPNQGGQVFKTVDATVVASNLHVTGIVDWYGFPFSTIRYANGTWKPYFDRISPAGGTSTANSVDVGSAELLGELQMLIALPSVKPGWTTWHNGWRPAESLTIPPYGGSGCAYQTPHNFTAVTMAGGMPY